MLKKNYKKKLFKKKAKKNYTSFKKINKNLTGPLRVMNPIKPKILKFVRSVPTQVITQSASLTNPNGTIVFKLSDCPSVTDFTNLFDKFRITHVKITWRLQDAPLDGGIFPTINSWKNYDVALTVPISANQVLQTPNVYQMQTDPDNRTLSHTITPYLITSVFNAGYTQITNKWVDMNYFNQAQYYGLAYYIENFIGTDSQQIKLVYDLEYHIDVMCQF